MTKHTQTTMNTNTKHTPLPWKVMLGFIVGPEDQAIASLYTTSLPPLQGEANGDLIAHSVNTLPEVTAQRDALIEALRQVSSLAMGDGLDACRSLPELSGIDLEQQARCLRGNFVDLARFAQAAITQAEKGQA